MHDSQQAQHSAGEGVLCPIWRGRMIRKAAWSGVTCRGVAVEHLDSQRDRGREQVRERG